MRYEAMRKKERAKEKKTTVGLLLAAPTARCSGIITLKPSRSQLRVLYIHVGHLDLEPPLLPLLFV